MRYLHYKEVNNKQNNIINTPKTCFEASTGFEIQIEIYLDFYENKKNTKRTMYETNTTPKLRNQPGK